MPLDDNSFSPPLYSGPSCDGRACDGRACEGRTSKERDCALPASDAQNREGQDDLESHEPSAVNRRLSRLRNSAMKAIRTRPRVPQPLFWSLLHSELKEIKRMKKKARLEREAWIRGEADE